MMGVKQADPLELDIVWYQILNKIPNIYQRLYWYM